MSPSIEAIEAIGADALIAGTGQNRLPFFLILELRIRERGLHHNDPRTMMLPIVASEDKLFETFDIDLEEVHSLPIRHMSLPRCSKVSMRTLCARRAHSGIC